MSGIDYDTATAEARLISTALFFYYTDVDSNSETVMFQRDSSQTMYMRFVDQGLSDIENSGVILNISGGTISTTVGQIDTVSSLQINTGTLEVGTISANILSIGTLGFITAISVGNISANGGYIGDLITNTISSTVGSISSLTVHTATATVGTISTIAVDHISSGTISTNNIAVNENLSVMGTFFTQGITILSANTEIMGDLTVNGTTNAVSFVTTSDARLKNNIESVPRSVALSTICALRAVTYNWLPESGYAAINPGHREYGLIAQEVEAVVPELVHTGTDGRKAVAYDRIVALLIEAVKSIIDQSVS